MLTVTLLYLKTAMEETVLRRGPLSWWLGVVAGTVLLMTAVVFLNAVALIALYRSRITPAHYPLISLATADMLVGLFVMPVAIARELYSFNLEWQVCAFWKSLDILCSTASILSLCVLGWERWSGITDPLGRATRARRARILAYSIWPASVAVSLPTGFMWRTKHVHSEMEHRACPENVNVGYIFFSITLSFYIPLAIMLGLYAKIVLALRNQPDIRSHAGRAASTGSKQADNKLKKSTVTFFVSKVRRFQPSPSKNETAGSSTSPKTTANNPVSKMTFRHLIVPKGLRKAAQAQSPLKASKTQRRSRQRHRRVTRAIIRLMGLFLVCWTPFFVLLPIDTLCECLNDSLWETATWLGYMNSALNPLVYAASISASIHCIKYKNTRKNKASVDNGKILANNAKLSANNGNISAKNATLPAIHVTMADNNDNVSASNGILPTINEDGPDNNENLTEYESGLVFANVMMKFKTNYSDTDDDDMAKDEDKTQDMGNHSKDNDSAYHVIYTITSEVNRNGEN